MDPSVAVWFTPVEEGIAELLRKTPPAAGAGFGAAGGGGWGTSIFSGEKKLSIGSKPCSSRFPVSSTVIPVLLQTRPSAPFRRRGADSMHTYRPW